MTNIINSAAQPQSTPEPADATRGAAALRPLGTVSASPEITTTSGEAVSVSADAQTMTQLLDGARSAGGVDQAAVQKLRSAVQGGTYNVSPETLARAIAGAFKEISS